MSLSRARTRTASSGVQHTNHESTSFLRSPSIRHSRESSIHLNELKTLLVSSFEVTPVMATSFKEQSHVNITFQNSIANIHILSGRLPFYSCLPQNRTFRGKVHTIKSNGIVKTVGDVLAQSDERKARHR